MIKVISVEQSTVCEDDGAVDASADWERTDDGEWLFLGRVSPRPGLDVTVREVCRG